MSAMTPLNRVGVLPPAQYFATPCELTPEEEAALVKLDQERQEQAAARAVRDAECRRIVRRMDELRCRTIGNGPDAPALRARLEGELNELQQLLQNGGPHSNHERTTTHA